MNAFLILVKMMVLASTLSMVTIVHVSLVLMEVTATLVSILSFVDGVDVKGANIYNYLNLTEIFDWVWYAFLTHRLQNN